MVTVISNTRNVDSVVQWLAHQGYNIDVVTLTAHTGGIAAGVSLMGKIAIYTGGVWKNAIAADTFTPGSTVLGVILLSRPLLAAVSAGATITKVPILTRGPAMVHNDGLDYTGHNVATTNAVLLERGIKVVDETGAAFDPVQT